MIRTKSSKRKKSRIKPGPKQLYNNCIVPQVIELARFGMTDKEIAEFYGVSISTFENWKRNKVEFSDALYDGRLLSSLKVVESLHKQACGYEYTEVREEYRYILNKETGEREKIRTTQQSIKKHIPSNVTAAIYLMKTRHGDKWADVIKAKITNNLNVKHIDMSDMSKEELTFMERIGMKQIPEHIGDN